MILPVLKHLASECNLPICLCLSPFACIYLAHRQATDRWRAVVTDMARFFYCCPTKPFHFSAYPHNRVLEGVKVFGHDPVAFTYDLQGG